MNRKLNDFLENKRNENFITVALDCDSSKWLRMSDFERFAAICKCAHFFKNSLFLKEFLRILNDELSIKIDPKMLASRENQKNIWRSLHSSKGEETPLRFLCAENDDNENFKTVFEKEKDSFNISRFFEKNNLKIFASIADVENEIRKASQSKKIVVDMTSFEFSRPNDYLADLIFKKIKSSDICTVADFSCIILYLLCNISSDTELDLCLELGDKLEEASRVIDFFDKRKKTVKISLCTKIINEKILSQIFDILLKYPKKNISSEIIVSEEIGEDIEFLFSALPSSRVRLLRL